MTAADGPRACTPPTLISPCQWRERGARSAQVRSSRQRIRGLEGGDDLPAEQLHRAVHYLPWHAAEVEVRAEHVIADVFAAFSQLPDHRLRATDNRDAVL